MATPRFKDVLVNGQSFENVSLAKLVGQPVADIVGYLSNELGGDPSFKITFAVLADGTKIHIEGEHDFPYFAGASNNPEVDKLLSLESLFELYEQDI